MGGVQAIFIKMLYKIAALRQSKTFKAFSIYFSTTFLQKAFYFFSFILFSHYLSTDDLGRLSIYNTSVTLLTGFTTWGVIYNLNTNFFRQSPVEFSTTFKSVIVLPAINIAVLTILLYFTIGITTRQFGFEVPFIWMIPLGLLFNFFNDVGLNMLRNNLLQKKYAIASGVELVLEILLATLLIVVFHYGWRARIISIYISTLIPVLFFLWFFYKSGYFKGEIKTSYWKTELFNLGPIIMMQVCIFMLNGADKFFITHFENTARTGLFSVATSFSSVIVVVSSAVALTIVPQIYKSLADDKNFSIVKGKFQQYFAIHLGFVVIISVLIFFSYTYLLNKSYSIVIKYSYISLIGYFFWTLSYFFLVIFIFLKLYRVVFALSLISIIFTFSSNYYLIKNYSFLGASLSIVIANLFLFLIVALTYNLIIKGKIKSSLN